MLKINELEKNLEKDGFIIGDVRGNSMSPFLKEKKDRVVITKLNRLPKLYDVVLYKTDNKYILHRIIEINDNNYIIRGDNRITSECVNKKEILGILTAYYNKSGYVEINDQINKKWFKRSKNSLLIRRIIAILSNKRIKSRCISHTK